ncbi:metallopeptidase TldD-related protein [Bengtsoniella intestinalis]|uniref:metallopeptidase TldD-related protein n=1 Tax=Bengtsoniella intestinalis TaxID=3073143 RepID=UPI00391F2B42
MKSLNEGLTLIKDQCRYLEKEDKYKVLHINQRYIRHIKEIHSHNMPFKKDYKIKVFSMLSICGSENTTPVTVSGITDYQLGAFNQLIEKYYAPISIPSISHPIDLSFVSGNICLDAIILKEILTYMVQALYGNNFVLSNTFLHENHIGKKIIHNDITLTDNPFLDISSFGLFDDEGTERIAKNLIQLGVLNNLLCDSLTANILKMSPGNVNYNYNICLPQVSESIISFHLENKTQTFDSKIKILHSFPQGFSYNHLSGEISMLLGGYINKEYTFFKLKHNILKLMETIIGIDGAYKMLDSYYVPNVIINFEKAKFV